MEIPSVGSNPGPKYLTIVVALLYVNKIKKNKKKIKIRLVKTKIMNQLSYHVSCEKLKNNGLHLNGNIDKEINKTLKLFKNIK